MSRQPRVGALILVKPASGRPPMVSPGRRGSTEFCIGTARAKVLKPVCSRKARSGKGPGCRKVAFAGQTGNCHRHPGLPGAPGAPSAVAITLGNGTAQMPGRFCNRGTLWQVGIDMNTPSFNRGDDRHDEVTVSATSARQGVVSGRVLTVLVASLVLAILALFIAWLSLR